MVRGASPTLVVLVALALLAPFANAHDGTSPDPAPPETVSAADHAFFSRLPPAPPAVRLWAQMSSQGDAYLTMQQTVLPHPYAPLPSRSSDAAMTFEAFRHITTHAEDDPLLYTSRPVKAAWNGTFQEDRPVVAHWYLSIGDRSTGPLSGIPPLLVTTTLKVIDEDDFVTPLASRTVRSDPRPGAEPTEVAVTLDPRDRQIPAGSRLVVELDWSWLRVQGVGALRQPLVSVHPGSYVDLPLTEPVRILSMQERVVSGDLYIQARIAHLFAVENLALGNTNLLVSGPGFNTQGGRPFLTTPLDGPEQGHVAIFDWRLPVGLAHLTPGTYTMFVTGGQLNEAGPRVIAMKEMTLTLDAILPAGNDLPLLAAVTGSIVLVGMVGAGRLLRVGRRHP